MDKRNLAGRIVTCVVFPPLIFVMLLYGDGMRYALPSLLTFVIALLASREIYAMLDGRDGVGIVVYFLPALFPVFGWLSIFFEMPWIAPFAFFVVSSFMLFFEAFIGAGDAPPYSRSFERLSRSFFLILYPNAFLTLWPEIMNSGGGRGKAIFILMLILSFSNDILCYVFGMLLGEGNRGFFKASAKKSIAGFVAGIVLTPMVALALSCAFTAFFGFISKGAAVFVGIATAVLCDLGDLAESAIKRSAGVKDSGRLIPGRGGILDSIDSLMAVSPLFFFISKYVAS